MDFQTVLMSLEVELIIMIAIGVPVMLAHHAFRLGFDTKTHQVSKAANEKSLLIDIVAILLSICELVIGIIAMSHIHYALKWFFAVVDFGIIWLAIFLETITIVDYFRNKEKFQKKGKVKHE